MSWWIGLQNPNSKELATVESYAEGGTYCVDGTTSADLNVTYNYGVLFDFDTLHNKMANETITIIEDAVAKLGIERDDDYWKPTEGNVGFTLSILLRWAKQYPNYIWRVS